MATEKITELQHLAEDYDKEKAANEQLQDKLKICEVWLILLSFSFKKAKLAQIPVTDTKNPESSPASYTRIQQLEAQLASSLVHHFCL